MALPLPLPLTLTLTLTSSSRVSSGDALQRALKKARGSTTPKPEPNPSPNLNLPLPSPLRPPLPSPLPLPLPPTLGAREADVPRHDLGLAARGAGQAQGGITSGQSAGGITSERSGGRGVMTTRATPSHKLTVPPVCAACPASVSEAPECVRAQGVGRIMMVSVSSPPVLHLGTVKLVCVSL